MMFRADQTTGKNKTRATNKRFLLAVAMVVCLSCTVQANTDMTELHHIAIAKSSLEKTLKTLAKQTGVQLLFPFDLVTTLESKPLSGDYTVMDALDIVLKDTGLSGSLTSSGVITISRNGLNGKGKSMSINTKKSLLASMVALMVGGAGPQVAAQDVPENEKSGWAAIDEIVVSARFRDEKLQDVGMSSTVVKGQDLVDSGVVSLRDLALRTPGMDLSDRGPNKTNISFRGTATSLSQADFQRGNAMVGIFLDDVPVIAASANQRSWNLFDLDRVEVVRGPQGTLYGEGTMGGAVRYVTKDPSLDSFSATIGTTLSNTYNGDGNNWRVDGTASIPLIEDKLAIRITAFGQSDAGFIDYTGTTAIGDLIGVPKKGANTYDGEGGRLVVLSKPIDDLTIRFSLTYEDSDEETDWLITEDASRLENTNGFMLTPNEDRATVGSLRIDYDLEGGVFSSITGYLKRDRLASGRETSFSAFGFPTTKDYPFVDQNISQEIRFVSTLDGPLNYLAGIYYKEGDTYIAIKLNTLGAGISFDEQEDYAMEQVAVFGEMKYEFNDQFTATLGLRYFREEVHAIQQWFEPEVFFDFPDITFDTTLVIEKVLPKLLFEYAASDDILLYSSVAQGARNGGFNMTGPVVQGHNQIGPGSVPLTYDEDSLWSYELGIKSQWFEQRLTLNAAVYYVDWSDMQSISSTEPFEFLGATTSLGSINNVGDARSKGLEMELSYILNDYVRMTLAGNYTDAVTLDDHFRSSAANSVVVAGTRIPNSPKSAYTAAVDVNYPLDELTVVGSLSYQYRDETNASLKPETPANAFIPDHVTPEQEFVYFRVGVEGENWRASLFVDNVFNELIEQADLLSVTTSGLNYFVNKPRTTGIRLGYDF